jgi:hypothetical protein
MGSPYVFERQSEYSASRSVEDFFASAGYECIALPIDSRVEEVLPGDFLFFDRSRVKLFGLQFKALYHNRVDHWRFDRSQHSTLSRFPWIYYALSELRDIRELRNSLHAVRIKECRFRFRSTVRIDASSPHRSWWDFYSEFVACRLGVEVSSADHLRQLLSGNDSSIFSQRIEEIADLFLANIDSRRLVHFSPRLANLDSP